MKIKNSVEILFILKNTYDQSLPAKSAYKIMRVAKALEGDFAFYTQKASEIEKEFAPGTKEYEAAAAELNAIESEASVPKLKISDLESLSLTPKQMYALEPIIEEE